MFRVRVLREISAARRTGILPAGDGDGGIYDTTVLTEDNELTFALLHLGHPVISPPECGLETEVMPTRASENPGPAGDVGIVRGTAARGPWRHGGRRRLGRRRAAGPGRRRRLRASYAGTRGRPSSGWGSLTPTELEVTALVAEGLNNPRIATRLLMGRGTVKTHLSHTYAKLDIANRTELASLVSTRSGHASRR